MEEDIWLLEESLKAKLFFTDRYYIALENLLTRYKQLEEENKNYINPSKARTSYFDTKKGIYVMIEGYVPEHLIEQKIEEYNEREKEELKGMKGQDRYFVKQMYNYMRKPLEELLRKE